MGIGGWSKREAGRATSHELTHQGECRTLSMEDIAGSCLMFSPYTLNIKLEKSQFFLSFLSSSFQCCEKHITHSEILVFGIPSTSVMLASTWSSIVMISVGILFQGTTGDDLSDNIDTMCLILPVSFSNISFTFKHKAGQRANPRTSLNSHGLANCNHVWYRLRSHSYFSCNSMCVNQKRNLIQWTIKNGN